MMSRNGAIHHVERVDASNDGIYRLSCDLYAIERDEVAEEFSTRKSVSCISKTRAALSCVAKSVALVVVAGIAINLIFPSDLHRGIQNCLGSHKHIVQLPAHCTLPSCDKIPSITLGVWQAEPGDVRDAVKAALNAGCKHSDGTWRYGNEEEVWKAIKLLYNRQKYVQLWEQVHAPKDVEPALDATLKALGVDYLDLYLIHWPIAFERYELDDALTADPSPTWQALEAMADKGAQHQHQQVSIYTYPSKLKSDNVQCYLLVFA
ncbi:Aldo/keto reductase, partial [Laetiporus sulphureus 93-53]